MRLDVAHGGAEAIAAAVGHWLDMSSQSGAFEAVLFAMAKKDRLPHWGSKGAINRAGEAIRQHTLRLA